MFKLLRSELSQLLKICLLIHQLVTIENTQLKEYFAYLFVNCWKYEKLNSNCQTSFLKINKYLAKKMLMIGCIYNTFNLEDDGVSEVKWDALNIS